MTTYDLYRSRAQALDALDDIFRSAAERPEGERELSPEERDEVEHYTREKNQLERMIHNAQRASGSWGLDGSFTPPREPAVNPIAGAGYMGTHDTDLTRMLWATAPEVGSGAISRSGDLITSSNGARIAVDAPLLPGHTAGTWERAPRITEFAPERRDAIRAFQATVAEMIVAGLLVDKKATSSADGFEVARSMPQYADRWNAVCRAMDVDTSGEGGTWVPTGVGASVHEKVRAMGKVAPLFARIDLPTSPWRWPIEGADATAYRIAEPTGDTEAKMTASTPGTLAATFDAEIFGARVLFSRSVEADAAVVMAPFVVSKIAKGFATAEERAILDGDTDGTHQDTDVHALGSADARWAWDGLRKKALAQTTVTATSTTVANLLALRAGMGKWGLDPSELAYIVGPSALHDLIADDKLLTVDKLGPNATILAGMIGTVGGVPVIVSEHVREDLNASGVHDGITETKTYNLCVNRNQWAIGQRMALDIEIDDSLYRETYQRVAVGFQREDFQSLAEAATDDDTAISFNVTP